MTQPADARPAAPEHRWLILGVIALAQLMIVLDATIMNIALPTAQRDLGFPSWTGSWWSPRTRWRSAAACAGYGTPCAELVFQPGRRMRPFYCLGLGQQLARLQGVAAPGHRRQPQVGDHRVQPPHRPADGLRPVPAQLRARRGGRHRRSYPAARRRAAGPGQRSRAGPARPASPRTGCAGRASRGSTSGAVPRGRPACPHRRTRTPGRVREQPRGPARGAG
jgi:hypothetical protein